MRKYCFFLMLVGCGGGGALAFGDGGDPRDASDDGPVADDAISPGDGSMGDGPALDADAGSDGDGSDGQTLPPYRRVFITSQTHKANFGGLAAGDNICGGAASAAGLGGTWAAWLSIAATSASSRLEHASVPYQLLDGTIVAADWTELTSGSLRHPIDHDENDNVVSPTPPPYMTPYTGTAWTGTNDDGTSAGTAAYTCDDWTYSISMGSNLYGGLAGINPYGEDGGATGKSWTSGPDYNCSDAYASSLYCIEQP
jgi:hypothetical protein